VQYLNIIRIIHLEAGLPNPLERNYALHAVLKGIQRAKGSPPRQKLPITPAILEKLKAKLDLTDSFQATFWCLCLIAFCTFCRKSTLVPKKIEAFDPELDLCQRDLVLHEQGAILNIKHTKTIQFRERILQVPLAKSSSALCPILAIKNMHACLGLVPGCIPLFSYKDNAKGLRSFTHSLFVKTLHTR
jgi:hypothetical protein